MNKDLTICLLNWNSGHFLSQALESIKNSHIELDYELIVIDNDSTDDSIEQARTVCPKTNFVLRGKNDGFSAGNNAGIQQSHGRYVLLLNPDTVVEPGTLETLVRWMDNSPAAGICGCLLKHPETGQIETSARAFPTLLPLLWNLSYIDRAFPQSRFFSAYQMTYRQDTTPRPVDWVTGACLMARREAVDQIGLLDENIFMYCEDVDWCYRFKQAGWAVYYLPQVQVGHYRGQSSKQRRTAGETQLSVWGARQYTKSVIYFYRKHFKDLETLCLRGIIVFTSLIKAALWLVGGTIRHGWQTGSSRARCYLSMIPAAIR